MASDCLVFTLWPTIFELNVGESTDITLNGKTFSIILHSVEHFWEPDYWIKENPARRTLREARIVVTVNGDEAVLRHSPYEMPVVVGGLRLYVETTHLWATECAIADLPYVTGDVRFSARCAGQPWGPVEMRFPIRNYRWRAATYNNTWSALVPYNLLYYHRGDDFGAIPDLLEVVAVMAGEVAVSPVPTTRGSNVVSIAASSGADESHFQTIYAHMNIETLDAALIAGFQVKPGQVLGKTGCTWDGWRSQWADPHLHVSFQLGDTAISPYPFLVEAYLRDYPDALLAVAGGYHFAKAGESVRLDATRTITRSGSEPVKYTWHLHTGEVLEGPLAQVENLYPGQYAEELVVRTADGHEDRDYAEIRVYDENVLEPELAHGWAYAYPLRGIVPGMPVLFWNRYLHTVGQVAIDFGDGSPPIEIGEQVTHAYQGKGLYTVRMLGNGHYGEPVMAKLRVVVG